MNWRASKGDGAGSVAAVGEGLELSLEVGL